jgi:hypothetical protein
MVVAINHRALKDDANTPTLVRLGINAKKDRGEDGKPLPALLGAFGRLGERR